MRAVPDPQERSSHMLHNPAKAKLLAGKPAYGYSLAFGSPLVAEALAPWP